MNTLFQDADDNPPFNFQAMLRKTNYKRNSLKRNNEAMSITGTINIDSNSNHESSNIVFQSRISDRPKSAQMLPTSKSPLRKYSTQSNTASDYNANGACLVFEEESFAADL